MIIEESQNQQDLPHTNWGHIWKVKYASAINVSKLGYTIKADKGVLDRSTKGISSARQLLACDIKEVRRVYPDIPNGELRVLINMNKLKYPEMRRWI